ncbi:hypothetical protein Tco_0267670 [Tanacetum coccineum]
MIRLRAETPSTSHPLPLPTSSPPLQLLSSDHRTDRPEITLPPQKRLGIDLGPSYQIGESSAVAATRPIRGRRADYGFYGTMDTEIRRQRAEEVGYGIRDVWVDPREAVEEVAPMTIEEVNTRVTELTVVQEQDTHDIYAMIEDTQDRQTQIYQSVGTLVDDSQYHYETARLLDQEALWFSRIVQVVLQRCYRQTSHIKYALIENPKIYVSLNQQFWGTTNARTTDDGEVENTARIDGQVQTITKASLRRHLKLEDSDGITSLPNIEIFEQLALMGYVSDSDRLTFQNGHFSPQWRFFIHTILHCLSPKTTAWEQFSINIATINEEERQRIAMDAEIAKQFQEEFNRARQEQEVVAEADQAYDINWSDPAVLRYHAVQNRSFSKAEVRKNMCLYLKNLGGYKHIHFKGMKYKDIRPIFERVWDQNHAFVPKDSEIKKEVMKRSGFDLQQESSKHVEKEIVPQDDVVAEQVVKESSTSHQDFFKSV